MKRIHFNVFLTNLYVFGSIISQPLVHLVTDAQHVVLDAQIGDHLELFSLVNLPLRYACFNTVYFTFNSHLLSYIYCTLYQSFQFKQNY